MAPDRTRRMLLVAIAAAIGVATGTGSGAAWAGEGGPHRYVRITSTALHPPEIHIRPEERMGWVNHSSHVAQISFDSEVARMMVCSEGGGFRVDGDALVSPRIWGRQFASLCRLKPGTYAYRVKLAAGAGGDAAFSRLRALEGVLVVDEAEGVEEVDGVEVEVEVEVEEVREAQE